MKVSSFVRIVRPNSSSCQNILILRKKVYTYLMNLLFGYISSNVYTYYFFYLNSKMSKMFQALYTKKKAICRTDVHKARYHKALIRVFQCIPPRWDMIIFISTVKEYYFLESKKMSENQIDVKKIETLCGFATVFV